MKGLDPVILKTPEYFFAFVALVYRLLYPNKKYVAGLGIWFFLIFTKEAYKSLITSKELSDFLIVTTLQGARFTHVLFSRAI